MMHFAADAAVGMVRCTEGSGARITIMLNTCSAGLKMNTLKSSEHLFKFAVFVPCV